MMMRTSTAHVSGRTSTAYASGTSVFGPAFALVVACWASACEAPPAVPQCTSNDCPAGDSCEGGRCDTPAAETPTTCSTACDCAVGDICVDDACARPPPFCASDAECPRAAGDTCAVFFCNERDNVCEARDAAPCAFDADCNDVDDCQIGDCRCTRSGVCISERDCESNANCGPGAICVSQTCVECADDSACVDGAVCVSGACVVVGDCVSKCDCGTGEVCVDGECTAPSGACDVSADCPRGPVESPARDDRCEAFQCNGFSNRCFDPSPLPCESAADCFGRPLCARSDDCVCDLGACVSTAPCDDDNGCTQDSQCRNGSCERRIGCEEDGDCPAPLVCKLNINQCDDIDG